MKALILLAAFLATTGQALSKELRCTVDSREFSSSEASAYAATKFCEKTSGRMDSRVRLNVVTLCGYTPQVRSEVLLVVSSDGKNVNVSLRDGTLLGKFGCDAKG